MAFSRTAIALLLLAALCSGATARAGKGVKKKVWCVAKPGTNDSALRQIIEFTCNKVNCDPIRDRLHGNCFKPNTLHAHASFVMSSLYNKTRDCHFSGNGILTTQDPSYGACQYPSHSHVKPTPVKGHKTTSWCIAKPGATDVALRQDKKWACGKIDCKPILERGPCFNPKSVVAHASFAMNSYFQNHGRNDSSCHFQGRGLLVESNPSYDHCQYFTRSA